MKFDIRIFFENLLRKFQISLQSDILSNISQALFMTPQP